MKVVSTKLANPEWEALVDKCNERGMTIAEYLRDLLQRDADNAELSAKSIDQKVQPAESLLDRIRKNRRTIEQPKPGVPLSELLHRGRRYHQ
jgi:arginine deiminase